MSLILYKGMKTIWKRNSSWTEAKDADAVIDELNQIPPTLERFDR